MRAQSGSAGEMQTTRGAARWRCVVQRIKAWVEDFVENALVRLLCARVEVATQSRVPRSSDLAVVLHLALRREAIAARAQRRRMMAQTLTRMAPNGPEVLKGGEDTHRDDSAPQTSAHVTDEGKGRKVIQFLPQPRATACEGRVAAARVHVGKASKRRVLRCAAIVLIVAATTAMNSCLFQFLTRLPNRSHASAFVLLLILMNLVGSVFASVAVLRPPRDVRTLQKQVREIVARSVCKEKGECRVSK